MSSEQNLISQKDLEIRWKNLVQKLGYQNRADYHWFVRPVTPIKAGLKAVTEKRVAIIDDGGW